MANELNCGLGITGLTVTAQLYTAGAASGSPISCPEISTSGIYTGTMAGAAATYGVAFLAGGVLKGFGQIIWDGTAEVTPASVMARLGAAGAGLTALGDTRIANLDATVSSRSIYAGGAVASVSGTVGGIAGTTQTLDALQTAQNSAHGAGSWATATGFATPTNITAASGVALAASQHVIVDSGTVTTLTNLPATAALEATLVEIKGVTFAGATDSLEALRDRGDAAWVTATGFATPTNITAGTITTVTNLTNAPTAGDLTATMKTSVTTAATAATPIAASVTGAVGSVTGAVGSVTGTVNADVKKINGVTITGDGSATPFGV